MKSGKYLVHSKGEGARGKRSVPRPLDSLHNHIRPSIRKNRNHTTHRALMWGHFVSPHPSPAKQTYIHAMSWEHFYEGVRGKRSVPRPHPSPMERTFTHTNFYGALGRSRVTHCLRPGNQRVQRRRLRRNFSL